MNLDKATMRRLIFIITFAVVLFSAMQNPEFIFDAIKFILSIFKPLIAGLCVAFIINILLKALEDKVFKFMQSSRNRAWKKLKRPICLFLSLLIIIGFAAAAIFLIYPSIAESVVAFAEQLPEFMQQLTEKISELLSSFGLSDQMILRMNINWDSISLRLIDFIRRMDLSVFDATLDITSHVINFIYTSFLAVVIAVYVLASKEKLIYQCKKVCHALFSSNRADRIIGICRYSSDVFSRFISRQLLESIILACLCFMGMLILKFPYAVLISALIGISAVIPVFGIIIGTAISALLILYIDPLQSLLFIVFIIILEQFESNVIYPRVVGHSLGLSAIWVIVAIMIGGSIGGAFGILVSVPVASILCGLIRNIINDRIAKKQKNGPLNI